MPKLNELSDKQISVQIRKYKAQMEEGTLADKDKVKLKALIQEKKKRKTHVEQAQEMEDQIQAEEEVVETRSSKPGGKVRNPWMVMLWMILTLGIYGLFYIYKTSNEIHVYRESGINGLIMLILSIIPIVGMVTIFLIPKYIKDMHKENGKDCSLDWYYGFLTIIPFGAFVLIYMMQNRLNQFWSAQA